MHHSPEAKPTNKGRRFLGNVILSILAQHVMEKPLKSKAVYGKYLYSKVGIHNAACLPDMHPSANWTTDEAGHALGAPRSAHLPGAFSQKNYRLPRRAGKETPSMAG